MDRAQILEDLKAWLYDADAFMDEVTPEEVIRKIEELEELYE